VLLLRAIAIAAAILSLLPLLRWLTLSRLAIGRVWLIRILRRPLLLAFAAAAGMLLMLLLMLLVLIAIGRLGPLLRSTAAGPIGRHATLTATRGGILMWPLRLTGRATGHIGSALAWALLLIHPDRESAPLWRRFRIGRGRRLGGGWRGRDWRLILIGRIRFPTPMAHPWHAHAARARRFAVVVVIVVVVKIGAIGSLRRRRNGGWRVIRRGRHGARPAALAFRSGSISTAHGSLKGRFRWSGRCGYGCGAGATRLRRWRGVRVWQRRHVAGQRWLLDGGGTLGAAPLHCRCSRSGRLSGLGRGGCRNGVIRRSGILAPGSATCRGRCFLIFWHKGLLSSGAGINARVACFRPPSH
jgi:hypothetical protein